MKSTTKLLAYFFGGLSLVALSTSCNKLEDFGNTNVDPNISTYAETGTLISSAQGRLITRGTVLASPAGADEKAMELTGGIFCQYFAEPTYPGTSRYTDPQFNGSQFYSGVLYDIEQVILRNTNPADMPAAAVSGSNVNQKSIARIMKAYVLWVITDKWGNVPYSEALKGSANLTPAYDPQELIYKDLLKELTEAVAEFDPNGVAVKGDLMYSGNIAKWKKLANSLRMLISLRTSKVYPNPGEYAAQEFSAAVNDAGDYIKTNADNWVINYPGNALYYNNPWYATANSADNAVAQTFTDALTGFGDTRINAFVSGSTTGVPFGLATAASTSVTYARILATPWKTTSGPVVVINASSVLLALSEAIERGWVAGDSKTAYDDGVKASFDQWNVSIPGNYLTSGPANFLSGAGVASIGGPSVAGSNAHTDTKLERINVQQWFSFYPMGQQGWANWRRTGMPDIKPTIYPATGHTQIPRRYTYGTTDYSLEPNEVAEASAAMGGDDQDTRMWWDKP